MWATIRVLKREEPLNWTRTAGHDDEDEDDDNNGKEEQRSDEDGLSTTLTDSFAGSRPLLQGRIQKKMQIFLKKKEK